MALNALMKISNAAGESKLDGFSGWIEIQSWDWEVEAETSWTKGGGASVGKPNPGKMNWEHYFDKSAPVILRYISSGAMFDKIEMNDVQGHRPGDADRLDVELLHDRDGGRLHHQGREQRDRRGQRRAEGRDGVQEHHHHLQAAGGRRRRQEGRRHDRRRHRYSWDSPPARSADRARRLRSTARRSASGARGRQYVSRA